MSDKYEVLALRYGTWESTKGDCFYRYPTYGEPDETVQMDFFLWVIRNDETTVLVDTGFHQDAIRHRPGRVCLTPPPEAVAAVGVDPESVSRIVVTHMHYDHTGNLPAFPNATLYLQRRELDFWTSSYGQHPPLAASIEAGEIDYVKRAVERGKVELLDGDAEVAPGVRARRVGGHCPGEQIVVVDNARPVVLASDAVHYYEEVERDRPYEIFTSLTEMYDAYAELRRMETEENAILVAGHDPAVMTRFPLAGNASTVRVGP